MEAKKGIPKSHLSEIMGDRKIKIADVLRCTNIGRNTCARVYQEKDMEKSVVELADLGRIDRFEYRVLNTENDRENLH